MRWGRKYINKYGNVKVVVDGKEFDSKKEAHRWEVLCYMKGQGEISELKRQVKFVLLPSQREPDSMGPKGGVKKGKVIEREIAYIADFTYKDKNGNLVVEDAKGFRTPEYTIKRKLMLWIHGIRISEV